MNICIVTHCYPVYPGDISGNWVPDFARDLRNRGHRICIFTPRMKGYRKKGNEDDREFEVRYFSWSGGERLIGDLHLLNPWDMLSLLSLLKNGSEELAKFVKEKGIDVCLGVWAMPGGYFCYRAKKKLNIPYAVWTLGSDVNVYGKKPILKSILKIILREADYLFANGIELSKTVNKLVNRKCEFMPTNRVLPMNVKANIEVRTDTTNFLYIGRLEKVKGIDILIDTMRYLLGDGVKANLYILGDGTLRNDLRKRVDRYKISENVIFKGSVKADVVSSFLRKCDCLVIPSKSEGMPVVFHEAMQAKTPVIVTNVGDMEYITKKYNVGKVVPSKDVMQLKTAMKEMMKEDKTAYRGRMDELAKNFDLRVAAETFLRNVESYGKD